MYTRATATRIMPQKNQTKSMEAPLSFSGYPRVPANGDAFKVPRGRGFYFFYGMRPFWKTGD